jgi:hypothetical protein
MRASVDEGPVRLPIRAHFKLCPIKQDVMTFHRDSLLKRKGLSGQRAKQTIQRIEIADLFLPFNVRSFWQREILRKSSLIDFDFERLLFIRLAL